MTAASKAHAAALQQQAANNEAAALLDDIFMTERERAIHAPLLQSASSALATLSLEAGMRPQI